MSHLSHSKLLTEEKDRVPMIKVTEDLITDAAKRNSGHCAIADAIKKSVPKAKRISVDLQTIRFSEKTLRYIYLTPRLAQKFIVDWDSGRPVKEIKFRLNCAQILRAKTNKRSQKSKLAIKQKKGNTRVPSVRRTGGKAPPQMPAQIRRYGVKALIA